MRDVGGQNVTLTPGTAWNLCRMTHMAHGRGTSMTSGRTCNWWFACNMRHMPLSQDPWLAGQPVTLPGSNLLLYLYQICISGLQLQSSQAGASPPPHARRGRLDTGQPRGMSPYLPPASVFQSVKWVIPLLHAGIQGLWAQLQVQPDHLRGRTQLVSEKGQNWI